MYIEEKTKEIKFSEVCLGDIIKYNGLYYLVIRDSYCDGEIINVVNIKDGYGYYIKYNEKIINLTTKTKVIIEG